MAADKNLKEQEKPIRDTRSSMETREPDFPELTRMRAHDRQHHVERAIGMGMTREEAERHYAEEHDEERRANDGRP